MAGPLSFGVSLIVERVLTMPLRSRRMVLESLESRQLLSVSPTSAEVSTLAKSKQFKESGTLTGSLTTVQSQALRLSPMVMLGRSALSNCRA